MIVYQCIFPNGKMYIGQTNRTLKKRIREHIRVSKLKKEQGYNYPFYRAIRKYGYNNLVWNIIDYAETQQELNEKEIYWISFYNTYIHNDNSNGYNQTIGGEGSNGLRHNDETIERIRLAEIGENNSRAKLSNEDVVDIFLCLKNKTSKQVELAKKYNISETIISQIKNGTRWSSITNAYNN